jgi:ABC-type phosphate transport system substrate-binding protein
VFDVLDESKTGELSDATLAKAFRGEFHQEDQKEGQNPEQV